MQPATVFWTASVSDIEESINSAFAPVAKVFADVIFYSVPIGDASVPILIAWLIGAALFFTIALRGIQVRGFGHAIALVRGKYGRSSDPGEVSHFQALSSAVSGTVGLGNIAGVAIAVTIGGAGATFWMIVAGLLGMCTKFVECTLGVKYREEHEDGTISGGPFRYLPIAFARFGRIPAKVLTSIFAVSIFFFGIVGGNMFQANQTYAQARNVTGGDDGPLASDGSALIFGIVLALLVGIVIIGGIKSIARITSKLVPAMGVLYVLACLTVLAVNADGIIPAFGEIISGAFDPDGVTGGIVGVLIVGFQRAAFSNEAGIGSAPIAHSAVKTKRPVTEGFVSLLEPFIDTVVICTLTALTIIIARPQSWLDGREDVATGGLGPGNGVTLTSDAFETVLPWFPVVLAVAVALFAFSTLITWAYYSQKAWTSLFGRTPVTERIFQVVFVLFTVFGSVLSLGDVVNLADAMLFLCAFINILGLYLLFPVVRNELREYLDDRRADRLVRSDVDA
ncbi:alanine/glycine:cation symporter family protein [Sanguibacter antarcticus]|uniref:AGCS family alanine or glycine:cation symporter n=1 Tax=Sanguibacter antarcticus TaxID=372484 RepID=A0A2A9E8V8_9MICO|nr:alanine/glycine:cation symporter family protein [Sanguibacter antarcticus]PFG34765.1 AGCS family alanine or glycine:cation symporter [Sanguibacter antarcticus]